MRVVFLGNASWSVPSLEALADSPHRPVLVLTRGARPAGRGSKLQRTPVAEAAERLGLPLTEVETVKSGPGFDALVEAKPEVLVVVAYGEILPKSVLDVPSVAPLNVHFSPLPELRGAAPVQWAILDGLDRTGVTTIVMDEGVDTGPILLQEEETIRPEDDAGSLGDRLAVLGGRTLVRTLDHLATGTLRARPQDEARATYARKLTPEDRMLRWEEGPELVARRVRALSPEPGAETRFRGKVLKVFRASVRPPYGPMSWDIPLGTIVVARSESGETRTEDLAVWTGRGTVVLLHELSLEGRKRTSGMEFYRGHRPKDGETLG
jgi:methionyl-tRNA formyltransferase